jgi:hypothetical protein
MLFRIAILENGRDLYGMRVIDQINHMDFLFRYYHT